MSIFRSIFGCCSTDTVMEPAAVSQMGQSHSTSPTQSQSSQDKKATAVYAQQRNEAAPTPKRVDVAAKFNQSGQALHKAVVSLMESTQHLDNLNRKDAELQARIAASDNQIASADKQIASADKQIAAALANKAKIAQLQQLAVAKLAALKVKTSS